MPTGKLSENSKKTLLRLARIALEAAVRGEPPPKLGLSDQLAELQALGASFVTLTRRGELRGCIGALEASKSLFEDVAEHAAAAGLEDYRFPPVQPRELKEIEIEISCLTPTEKLGYIDADDLKSRLRPGIDGVVLKDGWRRATFLPQVWEKLPDPEQFLDHLCQKMGAAPNTWRRKQLDVYIYQVEEFREAG
jgi:AmmeMemoRadiSam system protein A